MYTILNMLTILYILGQVKKTNNINYDKVNIVYLYHMI